MDRLSRLIKCEKLRADHGLRLLTQQRDTYSSFALKHSKQSVEVLDKVSSVSEASAPAHAAQCLFYFQLRQDHGRYELASLCFVRRQEIYNHEISFHIGRHATGGPRTAMV